MDHTINFTKWYQSNTIIFRICCLSPDVTVFSRGSPLSCDMTPSIEKQMSPLITADKISQTVAKTEYLKKKTKFAYHVLPHPEDKGLSHSQKAKESNLGC